MGSIISLNQYAFVQNRRIVDNVLLAHKLVRGYHRDNSKAKCALKVDLKKAYHSIAWDFVEECLIGLQLLMRFIQWVIECVRTLHTQLCVGFLWHLL